MTKTISNRDEVIDSRDIIARIEELQEKADALEEAQAALQEALAAKNGADNQAPDADYDLARTVEDRRADLDAAAADFDTYERGELLILQALAEEASGAAPDWEHGETLIRESYFVDYCQELLQDIGALPRDLPDFLVINWEATAENIEQDYTHVDFGGVTYLIR